MAKNIQSKPLKKVLIIAYSFPPMGGGRVRRVLKFVKYLQEYGWIPVILTVKKQVACAFDDNLLKELPADVKVIRTGCLEPSGRLKEYIRKNERADFFSVINRAIGYLCERLRWWVFIPDARIGWIPFAVVNGIKIIRQEDIDAILVIGEPYSSFFSGVILKLITKKPLILDFRDEWSELNKFFFPKKPKIVKAIERKMEWFVIKYADKIISVTDPIIETFQKIYPRYKDKFVCITNGFDPDDFNNIKPVRMVENKFIVTYAGSLYALRSPEYFLKALDRLSIHAPEIFNDMKVVFIGTLEPDIIDLLDNEKFKSIVVRREFMRYKEVLNYLAGSDLLLYIEDQAKIGYRFLPAKLFDYIGVKRPIMALAKEGVVKQVIKRMNCGVTVASDDIAQIESTLANLYNMHRENKLIFKINTDVESQFSRKELTGKLAQVLSSQTK